MAHNHDHCHGHGHSHAPADFGRAFATGTVLNPFFILAYWPQKQQKRENG